MLDIRDVVTGLDAGADEYLTKPVVPAALVARVQSMLRNKALHDTVQEQAARLEEWNRTLEERVKEQVAQLERVGRLRRFLSPQVAELIVTSGDERCLEDRRREITALFCDLRGFTPFSEAAEPEAVMRILREYHGAVGPLVFELEGTVEHFAGDGIMLVFNAPLPCPDPAARAVRLAVRMHQAMREQARVWQKRGHRLDFGAGIALGYATLGELGFEGSRHYAAIGNVANLASRLCGEAKGGQILVSQPVLADVEDLVEADPLGEMLSKGFLRPVPVYNVRGLRETGA